MICHERERHRSYLSGCHRDGNAVADRHPDRAADRAWPCFDPLGESSDRGGDRDPLCQYAARNAAGHIAAAAVFALPNIGVPINPISAAILALVMNTSAFNCEVWRSALMNFPKDQYEAAQSVGMRAGQRFRRIVLPQIVRVSLPGLVNEMSLLIKVTPVLAVVGVVDITRAAVRIGAKTYEPLPPLLVAVALYAPIVFALVSLQRWIERRQIAAEAAA